MAKTVTTENVEKEIVYYRCDICDAASNGRTCCMCKRDICSEHTVEYESDCGLETPQFNSDYPERMCTECWEKGEKVRSQIMMIRNQSEEMEDNLWKEWRRMCEVHKRPGPAEISKRVNTPENRAEIEQFARDIQG